MRRILTYGTLLILVLSMLTSCQRRPLWIYTDEFRQVELITDWSACGDNPGGMTAWFSAEELSGRNRRITTAEVTHTWLNLPRGIFTGIIFDYSPEEYGNQDFMGMSRPDSARVCVHPSVSQPVVDDGLYGPEAVPDGMDIAVNSTSGLYVISAEPDPMCADTLHHVEIITGVDGDLILWKDKETYEANLVTQTFYAFPEPLTWKLQTIVNLKGVVYLHSTKGSIAGLTDGIWLGTLRHRSGVCLHPMDSWESRKTGGSLTESIGTVTGYLDTFGLPNDITDVELLPPLRLNLRFLLRDEETVLIYNYDVPPEWVAIYPEQKLIRIEIPLGLIDLPYVDAKDSAGFTATVSPWEDGGTADVGF